MENATPLAPPSHLGSILALCLRPHAAPASACMAALLEACAAGDLTAAERAVEGGANVKLSLGRSGPPVWGRRRARTVARAASILDHGVGEG